MPDSDTSNDFDSSSWQFTDLIQIGKDRWSQLSEKFWRVPSEIKDQRYVVCQGCEHFVAATTQCTQCLCAMGLKTWLGGFECPKGKWPALEKPIPVAASPTSNEPSAE